MAEPKCVNHVDPKELTEAQKKLLEWTGEGFDLRTHIIDPKTGAKIRTQPYRMVVSNDEGTYFVRDSRRYNAQGVALDALPPEEAKALAGAQPKAEAKAKPKA